MELLEELILEAILKARLFAAIDAVLLADGTIDCRVNTMSRSAYTNELFEDPYMQPGGTRTLHISF